MAAEGTIKTPTPSVLIWKLGERTLRLGRVGRGSTDPGEKTGQSVQAQGEEVLQADKKREKKKRFSKGLTKKKKRSRGEKAG